MVKQKSSEIRECQIKPDLRLLLLQNQTHCGTSLNEFQSDLYCQIKPDVGLAEQI